MSDTDIFQIKGLAGQPIRDQFATIGALACMLADAMHDHHDGNYEDAAAAMSVAHTIGSALDSTHFEYLFYAVETAMDADYTRKQDTAATDKEGSK